MAIDILMIVVGLAFLLGGSDVFLRGGSSLAQNWGLSRLIIGVIIVGFGTSMPELNVSVGAILKGTPDIALGNIIGSNIANILLVTSIASIICPIRLPNIAVRFDIITMLLVVVLLCVLVYADWLNAYAGVLMLLCLIAYIVKSFRRGREAVQSGSSIHSESVPYEKSYGQSVAYAMSFLGLSALMGGAYLVIDSAISLAQYTGISQSVIGLTLVAVGTSLPELATVIVASLRKHPDMIIGNVLGSNILNVLFILGITFLIDPIPVSRGILNFDIWILLASTIVFSVILLTKNEISRLTGSAMLVAYAAYILILYT
jgi:cation:H+ antiporter